ncbi:hypothetical protein K435DRAFT_756926 [Dendrothele bispora CBS 962.96]|uniref:Zn(2)-C6 fungal-type domain-containing protein n=1 Tax=Dendrothele bispora (strain CBS 962.96) TaxID=1314807 RepID=A0A4S8LWB2_DENBC|nr:hypothetical protein K435DRAFT_756926 [Dendrothele bispora CBS 962.96]
MSTGSGPKQYVFKQPSKHLRRGQACLNCRYVYFKCDGVKPVCGPCQRTSREEECEYGDRPSNTTRALQQDITRLQARLRELEKARSSSSSPAVRLGQSSQPLPFGDPSRPCRALLNSVYLWGIHLSSNESLIAQCESIFLRRALRQVALDLSSALTSGTESSPSDSNVNSRTILETIQAEVLLAYYFWRTNQFMEAEFHVNGAISLCLSIGLHKVRSSRFWQEPLVLGVVEGRAREIGGFDSTLSRQTSRVNPYEEVEKINGFWTVFCLSRLLSIDLGKASGCFGWLDYPANGIDTPWPAGWEDFRPVCFFLFFSIIT